MKETRVFVITQDNPKFETALNLTDDEFINEAEQEGFVMTLDAFACEWNTGFSMLPTPDYSYIRILEVDIPHTTKQNELK